MTTRAPARFERLREPLTGRSVLRTRADSGPEVWVAPMPGFATTLMPAGAHERAKSDALATLKEMAVGQGIGDMAEIIVREGAPYRQIIDLASEIGTDLIVIASHDPGVADYLLGTVAARVVRHAHCSVFVTRNLAG